MKHAILFVDDDTDFLQFLEELAHNWTYPTRTVDSPQKALEIVEESDIHIVVADHKMPEMTGIELLNILKEQYPQIVRIMMTGYADLESAMDAINQGAVFRFFRKPFQIEQLKDILNAAAKEYDRKRARELLLEQLENMDPRSEGEQKQIASQLATIRVDLESGEILDGNEAGLNLCHFEQQGIGKKKFMDVFPDLDFDQFTGDVLSEIREFGVGYTQIDLRNSERDLLYNVTAIPVASNEDISSEKFGQVSLIFSPNFPLSETEINLYNYVKELEDSAELKDRGLKFLYEMSKKVATTQDFEEFVESIFDDLKEIIGFDLGFLSVYQETNTKIFIHTNYHLNDPVEESITGEVIRQFENETGEDFDDKPIHKKIHGWDGEPLPDSAPEIPSPWKANISIPLKTPDQELLGLLFISSCGKNSYTTEEIRLFATFSARVALVLHVINNLEVFQQVKELAIKDSLTGLYNRRFFEEQIQKEIERSQRYENPLSFLILDIDHFKSVNDTYGHLNGDEIIKNLAWIIRDSSRNIDIPIRYGGEEFAMILPETNIEGAQIFAERLRKRIEEHAFELTGDAAKNTPEIQITVSIGISHLAKEEHVNTQDLVEQGDKALYYAKESGRNRVIDYDRIAAEVA
ncbi:MAG: diguanylate cyclase [Candidatus Marinimicrobia bacterium]|nr:diguanylate cyclase [Candidatus Neomarinimicrobiota bacterium]MCF7880577.1 diguanylate cyclase [Candidatus Neomarinimicrobiota bacterium]